MTLSTLTRMSLTHCRRTSFQFALAQMLRWYAKKMQDRISSWKRRKRQAGGRCVHTNTLRVKTHTWTHTSIHLSLNESTAGIKWMKRRSLSVFQLHLLPFSSVKSVREMRLVSSGCGALWPWPCCKTNTMRCVVMSLRRQPCLMTTISFSAACVGGFVVAFRHCLVLKRESPSHAAAAMVLTLHSHFPLTFSRRFHPPATYRRVSTRGFRSWWRARFTDGQCGGSESLSRGFLRIGINLFV